MNFTAGLAVCWHVLQLTRTRTAAMGTECDCSVILFHLSLPNNLSFGFSFCFFFLPFVRFVIPSVTQNHPTHFVGLPPDTCFCSHLYFVRPTVILFLFYFFCFSADAENRGQRWHSSTTVLQKNNKSINTKAKELQVRLCVCDRWANVSLPLFVPDF